MRPRAWAATGLLLLLLGAPSAFAAGKLYVPEYGDDNVDVFDQGADGSLTPIANSPFSTGLGGTIGFGITPDGERAVASLLTGTAVSGFTIAADGALSTPQDEPAVRTYVPVMSPDNVHVYLPTDDSGQPGGIFAFSLSPTGNLTPVGDGRFGSDPTNVLAIAPDGRFLYARRGGNQLERFQVEGDGSLNSLGTTMDGCGGVDLHITPDGRFLLLACPDTDTVKSLAIGADGALASAGSLPVPDLQDVLPEVSPDGRFFYVPAELSDKVATVAIASDGSLSAVGEPVDAGTEGGVVAVGESPDGRFLAVREQGSSNGDLRIMSIGADGRPTLLPGVTNVPGGEPVAPVFRPAQAPVAALAAGTAAPGTGVSFDATGSTDPDGSVVRWDWDFGDGEGAADAGPSPKHAYDAAGVYTATVSVTDDLGCSTALVHQGTHAYCNGGPSATTNVVIDTLPAISRLSLTNKRFAAAGAKRGRRKVKRGTAFRYRLAEVADVTFAIARKTQGRRVGGRCRRTTRRNRTRKRCTLFKRAGRLTARGKAGRNRTKFSGKLRGKRLRAGSYRATAVATDSAGGKSAPKRVGFRIVRRR